MKLPDVIILALAVVFMIIGIHQTIVLGFAQAYWAIMLAIVLLILLNFRKNKQSR